MHAVQETMSRMVQRTDYCLLQISAIFTEHQVAAAGGGPVPQQIARRMDGALLAVGALTDILKQKACLFSHRDILKQKTQPLCARELDNTTAVDLSLQEPYTKQLQGMLIMHVAVSFVPALYQCLDP